MQSDMNHAKQHAPCNAPCSVTDADMSYRINKVGTDHCASAPFASLAMYHCNILRIFLKPVRYLLAEVID